MLFISSENIIFLIIIALPTFFILRWLLKKLIKNDHYRIVSTWAGTLILTPFLYLGAIFIFFSILFHEPEKDFERSTWIADSTHRYQMAGDIINSKILIGKDQNQLIQILGYPTHEYPQRNQWNYEMGCGGGGLGFMIHSLEVNFDKNKVISVYHGKIKD